MRNMFDKEERRQNWQKKQQNVERRNNLKIKRHSKNRPSQKQLMMSI